MDEIDHNARPKRARVLRASDVIPPFDKDPAGMDAGQANPAPSEPAGPESREDEIPARSEPGAQVDSSPTEPDFGSSDADSPDIPKYDLAENILAEQRRVAAKRRRSPGHGQEDAPPAPPEQVEAKAPTCGLPSEDLPELQRIVAEIVAKDIERLCRRPEE